MSVKEGAVSVQRSETSHNIQVLRGRTGNIVKVDSDRTAIVRDKQYGDFTFTEDILKFSMKEEGMSFKSCFPVGTTVYFDIEVGVQGVKCLKIWVSKKQNPEFSCSQPSSPTPRASILLTKMTYRGAVIKMLFPFAFVVELDSSKIPVFVINTSFKPNRHAAKLCGDQPVSLYVSKGDTVYVRVYRRLGKKFEWSACEAWMEESNTPEPSTRSDDPFCRQIKKQQHKRTNKTEKKICNLKGKLSFVGSEIAHLESTDCSGTVIFNRDNAFLFGVPMKGLRLDQIFRTGEELSFVLSGDDANEASRVWFGPFDVVSQSFEERMNCILKYCMEREICESYRTTIIQELGKQRPLDEDKWDSEDELEETFGCPAAEMYSELSTGSAVGTELNGSCGHETGVNQADQHKDFGHMDLRKGNLVTFISDMETKPLCFSDRDTESEFCTSIIDKDVECNLKASLMSVLKKHVGESQILARYVVGFVEKEIDCMMQDLMVKVLSSIILNETGQKKLNSDLQCGDACRLMITSMVQEWKEEMLLVTNKRKAEKEKKMEAALDRVRKLGQRVSALCCSNTTSTQSNACSSSSDDNSANYSDESISCVVGDYNEETAEKSTIMQDFMQLLNISDCQMVETPKSVSEQGSQTISTGCILYLNYLSDP